MNLEQLQRYLFELEKKKISLDIEIHSIKSQIERLSPFSKTQKIKLFKDLFIGNDQAYAKHWINKDGTKKGYAPVTGTFRGKDYIRVTDNAIQRHLEGKDRIGSYAVKSQTMCSFLAIDLDKQSFTTDARAINKVANKFGISAYFELSKSGNGIHIWFFFSQDVLARDARILGDLLITQAMDLADGIDMKSYDRLFPNQDYVPPDALGNLIALPLHFGSRGENRTVFINIEDMNPYPNQWDILQKIVKITPQKLHDTIEAYATQVQESTLMPWEIKKEVLSLPKTLKIVLHNSIYIEKLNLSNSFLNLLKRMASFYNPEFFIRQKQRRSIYNIPRIVSSYDINERYILLPRGLYLKLYELLKEHGVNLTIEDKRLKTKGVKHTFILTMRPEQKQAIKNILQKDTGVIIAPPGFGKTAIASAVIEKRGVSTLILVHKTNLLEQWVKRLSEYFDIDSKEIGMLGKGKKRLNGLLDVATIQSMKNRPELVEEYSQLIIDESHHLPAVSFEDPIKRFCGKYILGLSATPKRRDGMEAIMYMQCGGIVHEVKKDLSIIHSLTTIVTSYETFSNNFSLMLSEMTDDEDRNHLIVEEIQKLNGFNVLVLSERIEHLNILWHLLNHKNIQSVLLHGALKTKEKKIALKNMHEASIILSTSNYIGEGVDIEHLDTIVLTMPISYPERIIQYLGRVGRQSQKCRAIDFVDEQVPMLKSSFTKRLQGYKKMGYVHVEKKNNTLF